jgi:hypothetical protein
MSARDGSSTRATGRSEHFFARNDRLVLLRDHLRALSG